MLISLAFPFFILPPSRGARAAAGDVGQGRRAMPSAGRCPFYYPQLNYLVSPRRGRPHLKN